jgi:hypothetical protein
VIWTWGTFVVPAEVVDLEGFVTQISHQLSWDIEVDPAKVEVV